EVALARGTRFAASAILSTIASLGDHRVELSPADAVAQMTSIAVDLAASVSAAAPAPGRSAPATPPASPDAPAAPRPRLRGGAATREEAITAAITRFHRDGYDAVSMESIGADVGIAASALYRHFSGKSGLLTAAVDRTAAFVEATLDDHAARRGPTGDPGTVLAVPPAPARPVDGAGPGGAVGHRGGRRARARPGRARSGPRRRPVRRVPPVRGGTVRPARAHRAALVLAPGLRAGTQTRGVTAPRE